MATIQVRMSDEDKEVVERILDSMGLDVSTAVRAYFKQIRISGSIPFPLQSNLTINGFTPEFEEEVLQAVADKEGDIVFDNADDALKYLDDSSRETS